MASFYEYILVWKTPIWAYIGPSRWRILGIVKLSFLHFTGAYQAKWSVFFGPWKWRWSPRKPILGLKHTRSRPTLWPAGRRIGVHQQICFRISFRQLKRKGSFGAAKIILFGKSILGRPKTPIRFVLVRQHGSRGIIDKYVLASQLDIPSETALLWATLNMICLSFGEPIFYTVCVIIAAKRVQLQYNDDH